MLHALRVVHNYVGSREGFLQGVLIEFVFDPRVD